VERTFEEPWLHLEDDHVLIVRKPVGVNTHRADADAQDGMYEWVQRQRRSEPLSILHRLDKTTSGLLLFGKSTAANRALVGQFADRQVAKTYELIASRDDRRPEALSSREALDGRPASTDFTRAEVGARHQRYLAHPHTGRTHQVRAHAAGLGLPIVGDTDYGGAAAARVFLHAAGLGFRHPVTGEVEASFPAPPSFDRVLAASHAEDLTGPGLAAQVAFEARATLFDPVDTDALLWIDRHHDGFPDTRVERLGNVALAITYRDDDAPIDPGWVEAWMSIDGIDAVYEQRRPRGGGGGPARLVSGGAPPHFEVSELGCRYLIDLDASATSSGLFLDQRETRRRLLTSDLAGRTVLNAFAHTGSLSVAAALAGASTLTLDLSKRYLAWAADNLRANGIDPADHDSVFGDAADWMDRWARKGRTFDLVLVDPPSSSTARRRGGRWAVDRDLHSLVERAAALCAVGGTVYVSTNLRPMGWDRFDAHVVRGLAAAGRRAVIEHQTLPLDHRSGPGDPPYLKAAWLTLDGP
jgi:23S rRNA (cytosine1962-C5)-methyltransferase